MAANVPMADLAKRWGVTANTVSRRLTYLKIKPIRQGNYRYITVEQLKRADALDQHVCKNKVMYTFMEPVIIEDEKEERYGKIYFIGSRTSGPVKIGFSSQSDLKSRLGQLQTSSPEHLEILGSFSGYIKNERKVHDLLAPHRLRGEWFERKAALAVCNYFNSEKKSNKFADEFSNVACSLEGDETDDGNHEEPLAVEVAQALLLDYWQRLRNASPDQPLPFRAWLLTQTERDHATADLANDCKCDPDFPAVASLPEYLQHVDGSWDVTRTVVDAWMECHSAVFSLAH
jgi:hypothetical protein